MTRFRRLRVFRSRPGRVQIVPQAISYLLCCQPVSFPCSVSFTLFSFKSRFVTHDAELLAIVAAFKQ